MKYLIAGLGNIGEEYANTRHNAGFMILDAFAAGEKLTFTDKRYGSVCSFNLKGRKVILLKPSTYMNLSGNAVSYWLTREKIELSNLLVIVDDIALPAGTIRMRPKGSDGGHNGLASINASLGTNNYARIRFGIGNSFSRGRQVDYVLGEWTGEELDLIKDKISLVCEMIKSFVLAGTEITMTKYNRRENENKPPVTNN